MFIILLTYKKPLEIVDQYLPEHRAFLEGGYQQGYLIASGPQNPRTGGVILSNLKDRRLLDAFIKQDPFQVYEVADYQVIEFDPVKFHDNFKSFIA